VVNYTPKFSDARIQRRISKSLDWCNTYLSQNKRHWLSFTEIQRQFGSQSRPLGQYLRRSLLICVNPYYSNLTESVCKTYKLNLDGYHSLCEAIDYEPKYHPSVEVLETLDTGEFEYKTVGHRDYHPLQNLPKRIKQPLLASKGYRHEYDIECCAQTLLVQHSRKLGLKKPTPALDRYISDRTSVRSELMTRTGLDSKTIKQILTALLNGSNLSCWHTNSIFAYVNYNKQMIQFLKEDHYIQQYICDVRGMWSEIRKHQSLRYKERFNAKMKSEMYRSLEEEVRVVIQRYLKKTKNRAFVEHDGWSCQTAVDTARLTYEVKRQTGFVIKLDWTIHEYVDCY
jgi:hypothetical protein